MAKIVMWGSSTTATEEQKAELNELQNTYASFSLQTGDTKDQSVLKDCIVLLEHDTDNLENYYSSNPPQWKIICSGSIRSPKIDSSNKTAGIPPAVLTENLNKFLSAIETKTVIEQQDIELLFAIDPELENRLKRFTSLNPFKSNHDRTEDLKDAKLELQVYVEKYLKERSQP